MGLIDIEVSPKLPVPKYEYVTDELRARTILSELSNYEFIEVDTEGTALDPYECRTTLLQLGVPGKSYVFDIRSDLDITNIHGSLFKEILEDTSIVKLLQNANYDLKVLKVQFDYYIRNIYDTMLAEQLLKLGVQSRGFSLAALVKKYLGLSMDKEPRNTFSDYYQRFDDRQLGYAALDVCVLDILRNSQWPAIEKYGLQEALKLEMDFTIPLAEMELNGILLDVEKWRIIMSDAEKEAAKLREFINHYLRDTQDQTTLFGMSVINIDSPLQLKDSLNKLGLSVESTDVSELQKYEGHELIDALLKYRKLNKLVTTYGEALIERINKKTGRLHTEFKQMVSTGRMSSNNPNLQNIPGKQVFRSCFIAREGYKLITVDQNSAELLIMGAMSNEPHFIETYTAGLDLHTTNASKIFDVPYDEVTKDQRKASKAISFGLCIEENQLIATSNGTKPIRYVEVGDFVDSDFGFNEVLAKYYMGNKECVELTTELGFKLVATKDHLIKVIDANNNYIDKEIKDLDLITDSICLKLEDSSIVTSKIKSITSAGYKNVYDLTIDSHPYFVANGFIVHNCYGIAAPGLARRLGVTNEKAQELINKFFEVNSILHKWLDDAARSSVQHGYSKTVTGRCRFYNIPPYNDPSRKKVIGSVERAGKNHRIQGCLTGHTQIRGLGTIRDLVGKVVTLNTGFGYDAAVGIYSGKKEVFDLTLSNGSVLNITLNHKIPTVTDDSFDIIDKDVSDLSNNDYLMVPLTVEDGEVTDFSKFSDNTISNCKNYKMPLRMSCDLAFIIGCLIGDGNYTQHGVIRLVCPNNQTELADKFCEAVSNVFGYSPNITYTHKDDPNRQILPVYTISSVLIRKFFEFIGLDYVNHKYKKIPSYFFSETVENKCALLNGLFSTDGGITKNSGPNYTTISESLAYGIQNLLFSLGINSNLKKYESDGSKVYRLQIHKRFNTRFNNLIGFSVNSKTSRLIENEYNYRHADGSIVPKFIPRLIEKELRNSKHVLNNNQKAQLRSFKLGKCSFNSWRKYYKLLPDGDTKSTLSRFINMDFVKVSNISYRGIEDTYDLICSNIHYFIANGVIVHNSDADTIKKAMIICVDKLSKLGYDARLLLSVHDEIVVEAPEEHVEEVAKIVTSSVDEGFNTYFSNMPMYTDPVIGPCWIKSECEECGHNIMEFKPDDKYISKLYCSKCGEKQD